MTTDQNQLRDPRFRTLDGMFIVDGLRVWDYDLRAGTVCFSESRIDSEYWDGWFAILRDDGPQVVMNGERLWTRHPVDQVPPPPFIDDRATGLRAALHVGARLIVDVDPERHTCPAIVWNPRVPSDPRPWRDTVSHWRYRSTDVRPCVCDYCDQPATRKVRDTTDEFVCEACARDQFTNWREATSPLSQRHVSDRFNNGR